MNSRVEGLDSSAQHFRRFRDVRDIPDRISVEIATPEVRDILDRNARLPNLLRSSTRA